MSVRLAAALALLLTACTPIKNNKTAMNAVDQGKALAEACKGRDGWSDTAPPARIFGNTYYVGTCGISVILVTSPKGHVLIDGATDEAVPSILENIRALGFDPRDIKYILGSHEHVDHMGGFAQLKAATGARLLVAQAARAVVETGRTDPADPQLGIIADMKPVAVDGTIAFDPEPGDIVVAKPTRLMGLRPYRTPGHTSGGTSWGWQSCEGRRCLTFAYVDSLSAIARDDYRFTDHPERVAPFRETFARVEAMPCDILITPHPSVSSVFERLSGTEPLIDDQACRRLAQTMREKLDSRLAKEAAK
ncbi:MAG: subclass B3 metallo-beta-lactamase [Sphingorhabdus sp.]